MLKPVKKLKERMAAKKAAKKAASEPQMYKKPQSPEERFNEGWRYKKGGAVKKTAAKKPMVKSKKK